MPVNQNIQNFYKVAAAKDFSRDFLFRIVELNIAGVPAMTEDQLVYAKGGAIPGRQITNVAAPYMGLNINVPGGVTYPGSEGYTLTFYLDSQSELRTFFEAASRNLFDDLTSTGAYGTPDGTNYMILAQLDKDLNPINTYKLVGASIRNVGAITYNVASGTGTTVEVTATIAYHFYLDPRDS